MSDKSNCCSNCQTESAKFNCSSCKSASYCSQACQKVNWPIHKQVCQKTVVVVNGDQVSEEPLVYSRILNGHWKECTVPAMLGVPIKVMRLRPYTSLPHREIAVFMMVDPVTGFAPPEWSRDLGVLAFVRTDLKEFKMDLFWSLYSYIFGPLMDL